MDWQNSWVEISQGNLRHNVQAYRQILPDTTQLAVVVKSNAYGHDMALVAQTIAPDVDWFCTVNGVEALALRQAGITQPLLVLSYWYEADVAQLIENDISVVAYTAQQVAVMATAAQAAGKPAKIHLKVDTGTSRLGVTAIEQLQALYEQATAADNVVIEGVFSHFAASEDEQEFTRRQIAQFEQFVDALPQRPPICHLGCTASGMVVPDSNYDMVRLGVGAYGLWPSHQAKTASHHRNPDLELRPALTWKTRVIQTKTIPAHQPVGYGCTYTTKRPTKLAVLPVGYWEGYDRNLSNKSHVLIHGQRCPLLGRVCMNLIMVDVTEVQQAVQIGDEVVLLGKQGAAEISAEDMAEWLDTISYEVVTRINPILSRRPVA